ncbi:SRPBCC family protein [Ilumatobacter sp.]|uniref:SRPBCC family protein n=1 Tax=Ilumatobacter sp. TaxID=1967498 RepID=UPI003B51EB7C
MTVVFRRCTILPARPDVCYATSLDVDFHQHSFEESDERAVGGVQHGEMSLDDTVTWSARHFGRTWTMSTVISEVDPPHRFVDEQIDGPFRSFRHEHTFRALGESSTEMWDHVSFVAPYGPAGWIAEKLVLGWYLPKLIDVRNAALVEEVGRRG